MGNNEMSASVLELALSTDDAAHAYGMMEGSGLPELDAAVESRLREGGLTEDQILLVYEIAKDVLEPRVARLSENYRAARELEKLEEHFGGGDRFDEISRQIKAWGKKHLPASVLEGLSTTCEGVIALYNMMGAGEPRVVNVSGRDAGILTEGKLKEMMRDPRYWRDNDREFVKAVDEGFKRLYD